MQLPARQQLLLWFALTACCVWACLPGVLCCGAINQSQALAAQVIHWAGVVWSACRTAHRCH